MINGYGPYRYRVTYENGEHHWEYLGPVEDGSDDGQDVTNDGKQDHTVTREDIEDLSPEEIENIKKEWEAEALEEWKGLRARFGLVYDRNAVNGWKKKGYRLYDDETDAYIDGETGEIKNDTEGVFDRRLEGDEIVYSKSGEDVGRMLQWRAYLGRSSKGDEEMLLPIDESDYEPDTHEKRMAVGGFKGDRKPVNHREVDWI